MKLRIKNLKKNEFINFLVNIKKIYYIYNKN